MYFSLAGGYWLQEDIGSWQGYISASKPGAKSKFQNSGHCGLEVNSTLYLHLRVGVRNMWTYTCAPHIHFLDEVLLEYRDKATLCRNVR